MGIDSVCILWPTTESGLSQRAITVCIDTNKHERHIAVQRSRQPAAPIERHSVLHTVRVRAPRSYRLDCETASFLDKVLQRAMGPYHD